MAWAGTTTHYESPTLAGGGISLVSTTLDCESTVDHDNASGVPAGMVRFTTHTDVLHIPFNRKDGKMVIFGNLLAPDTSVGYVACAVRYPESTDGCAWRSPVDAGSSTEESGWKMFYTTNFASGSSLGIAFVAGPFESAKYGHTFGGTSSNGVDTYQKYLEVMFMMTTAATTPFLTAASSSRSELMNVAVFEVP